MLPKIDLEDPPSSPSWLNTIPKPALAYPYRSKQIRINPVCIGSTSHGSLVFAVVVVNCLRILVGSCQSSGAPRTRQKIDERSTTVCLRHIELITVVVGCDIHRHIFAPRSTLRFTVR